MKKIISLAATIATALSIITTAQAAETESKETVIIAGCECWVENGYYFTDVDGEICQVINLDDYAPTSENEQSGIEPYGTINGVYYDTDLSPGQTYTGMINIKNGDDETPIFFIEGSSGVVSVEFSTGFVLPTTYNVTIVYNFGISPSDWTSEPAQKITFNFAIQTHKFFIGTGRQDDCLFKIIFHKDGSSTTETNFRYKIKKGSM